MLNCNLKDSAVSRRIQLKSVIKCDTLKNRQPLSSAPGFGPPRINLLLARRFEDRIHSRRGRGASRLDHAGAFGKGIAGGGTRRHIYNMHIHKLWTWLGTPDSALLKQAAPGLSSASDLPGGGALPHNRPNDAGAAVPWRFMKRPRAR